MLLFSIHFNFVKSSTVLGVTLEDFKSFKRKRYIYKVNIGRVGYECHENQKYLLFKATSYNICCVRSIHVLFLSFLY